ncbi:MAG TPA: DUF1329 domain-containing protein [Candidatus Binatia bacterium]|nr:DUF1329 domain-containing protein [Candidatus Binatia bacterium]
MLSKHLSKCLILAMVTWLCSATGTLAQVDWSDLFPEEGAKPAAKPAPPPAAAPAPPAARAVENPAPRVAAKPERVTAPTTKVAHLKPAPRRVAARPQVRSDREFPEAAEVAPPNFDRHSQRRSSPPPGTLEEQEQVAKTAPELSEPARVAAKADAAPPAAVVREPEPEREPIPANKVEPPAAHESARVAMAERAPEAAPAAVGSTDRSRAARAAAAQPAKEFAVEAPPRHVVEPDEAPVQVAAASAEAATSAGTRRGGAASDATAGVSVSPGDVISDKNMGQYEKVLTPGLEWALKYGLRMRVAAPRHVAMTRAYREATEKYAGQVKLSADGTRITNWTAGQPFPNVDTNDPQAAVKIMWNYSYGGYATDDLNAELFDADTGTIGKNRGMTVERHYMIDNLRRLMYTGRLVVDPKPELPNPDGVRYKESLHPLSEPFDLKGVGGTFYRYSDPDRQDDSWLYLPQLRRVRRLSSAQRSDALFGQDSDVDSYYGYSGNVAWMDWKFLGERTVMAVMHGENAPVKWQQPEDWIFDEVWEPRQVYVVEGNSKFPQYAYGKRVIYIDKEAYVVAHSDIYDRAGQLWKVWFNSYSFKKEAIPGARVSRYPDEMSFITAISMLDTQLVHATKAALPSTHSQGQECVYYNMGEKSGTKEDFFTVANLIEMGH